jgi:hypothetical protein
VIVVCWNAADVLGRCLDHLFAQSYAEREIIVVDDGSDDDTAQVAERARERGELTLVRSTRNRGCPAARNLGMSRASGEIVAFVDADGFAAPDWLCEVVLAFGDDPKVGGVASTVFYDDNPLVINGAGGTTNRQGWAADLSMSESYEHASLADEALYPMGCGMAVRREALECVGPFDDRMINYYDDVDYGTRLWRAGFSVAVAADAWIDHGIDAGGGDSPRKRLWCERHRMRVVLKHAPARSLVSWAAWELRGLFAATAPVRVQKLRSIVWNLRHLPSALRSRRAQRGESSAPERLYDASSGDGFPVGVPLRFRPAPECAGAKIEMAVPISERQLVHGWFPADRVEGRSYRWAGTHSAALVHLDQPAKRLRLDFAHVPVDIGAVDVHIRPVEQSAPDMSIWRTRLAWQYVSRAVENHPLELAPGDYEVCLDAAKGWSDPPRETRSLALALSSLSLEEAFAVVAGGLDMAGVESEQQLVRGWFEGEDGPAGRFRWGGGSAAALVSVLEPAHSMHVTYRLPPGSVGHVRIALSAPDRSTQTWSTNLAWRDSDWHDEAFDVELAPGDYVLTLDAETTWSNPNGDDRGLPPENRALGFALASLAFAGGALR